jgi:hypothetical protein
VSGEERWRWEGEYEPVEEDEEVVEDEYEVVDEEEEVVESDEEVVEEDEEVVAGPRVADPVYAYILGVVDTPPAALGEWRFYDLLVELRKAERLSHADRVKRLHRLIWLFCPYKPRRCPIFTVEYSACPIYMERSCRAYAFLKPRRKARSWFRKTRGRK